MIVVCHYSEIALKGKNRKFFEETLILNIKKALDSKDFLKVRRVSGRILVDLKSGYSRKRVKEALGRIFGIHSFSFALESKQNIKAIEKKSLSILENKRFKKFRVSTKRSNKDFKFSSQKVNEKIGKYLLDNIKGVKVDLENPGIVLRVEIVEDFALVCSDKFKSLGGLPVGVGGKAVVLLSGGIDSPLASFYANKRGLRLIFVHFHAYPHTSGASMEKVRKLVSVLNKYQFSSKIYLVPFSKIQEEVSLKAKSKLRIVLYRRFMFKISELIAKKEKAKALITGENLGQVASQTIENIGAISEAVDLPIIRPLITNDKEEIINKAKEIGTYEISILPYQDCCARFLPKFPEIKADVSEVKKEEKKINVEKLIKEAVLGAAIEIIKE